MKGQWKPKDQYKKSFENTKYELKIRFVDLDQRFPSVGVNRCHSPVVHHAGFALPLSSTLKLKGTGVLWMLQH
jgi:hypothetical protein